jgi:hypothetical protein
MTPRAAPGFLAALVICLALVAAAVTQGAAKHGPKSGTYIGKTAQSFSIRFKIAKRTISAVDTTTKDRCSDGSSLEVRQNAFGAGRLDRKGRFTLRAGPRQQPAVIKGRVKGSKASGTITDRPNDPSGHCSASTTWRAKLAK